MEIHVMYILLDQGGSKQNLLEILSVGCSYHTVRMFFGLNTLRDRRTDMISLLCVHCIQRGLLSCSFTVEWFCAFH